MLGSFTSIGPTLMDLTSTVQSGMRSLGQINQAVNGDSEDRLRHPSSAYGGLFAQSPFDAVTVRWLRHGRLESVVDRRGRRVGLGGQR